MPRRKMTEEEKAAFNAKMKAAREAKKKQAEAEAKKQEFAEITVNEAETPVEFASIPAEEAVKKDQRVDQLEAMVRQLQQELAQRSPQIVQVMGDTEKVVMRFQADVADDNVAVFGPNGMFGQVTGKTGTVIVPKNDWSRFYNESVRRMIDNRWLVVLSGMNETERDLYRCSYKEGEVLDEKAFNGLLDMGRDLLAVFPALCPYHQEMVARRFAEGWRNGDARTKDRDLIVSLNEMSKKTYENMPKTDPRKKGMFKPIIEEMNEADMA